MTIAKLRTAMPAFADGIAMTSDRFVDVSGNHRTGLLSGRKRM